MDRIVLASASPTRRAMLTNAGVRFTARPAPIDERAVEASFIAADASPMRIAEALANAKALAVRAESEATIVLGADQVLEGDGRRWNKPASLEEARAQLRALSGKTHALHSAIAAARGGRIVWKAADSARLTMRPLTEAFIDGYLAEVGEAALGSVGAYQVEGLGIQLFDKIEGDHFTILGLPLLDLLAFLRREGEIGT
jgi:septum formation protein